MATIQSTIKLTDGFSPVIDKMQAAVGGLIIAIEKLEKVSLNIVDAVAIKRAQTDVEKLKSTIEKPVIPPKVDVAPKAVTAPAQASNLPQLQAEAAAQAQILSTARQINAEKTAAAASESRVTSQIAKSGNNALAVVKAQQSSARSMLDIHRQVARVQNTEVKGAQTATKATAQTSKAAGATLSQLRAAVAVRRQEAAAAKAAASEQNKVTTAIEKSNRESAKLSKSTGTASAGMSGFASAARGARLTVGKIAAGVAVIAGSIYGIRAAMEGIDSQARTLARVSLIADTPDDQAQFFASVSAAAERSRADIRELSNVSSRLALLAPDSFSNLGEAVKFSELMGKNFAIAGASTQEMQSAWLQLTQALSSGRLQGEEYRSIIENAPLLAKAIEESFKSAGVEGSLKEWASEGMITSDVIKKSLFNSADLIEERFDKMPMTFSQVFTLAGNKIYEAFQPLTAKISKWLSSGVGLEVVEKVADVARIAANALEWVIDRAGELVAHIKNNWTKIKPVVDTLATAIGVTLVTAIIAAVGAFALANAPLFAIAGVITYVIRNFETMSTVAKAVAAAVIIAAVAIQGAILGIPLPIIGVISAILAIGATMGITYDDVVNVVGKIIYGFEFMRTIIRNIGRAIYNSLAKFIARTHDDFITGLAKQELQLYNFKKFFINIWRDIALGVDGVLVTLSKNFGIWIGDTFGILRSLFDALNQIPGVNIVTSVISDFISPDGYQSHAQDIRNTALRLRGEKPTGRPDPDDFLMPNAISSQKPYLDPFIEAGRAEFRFKMAAGKFAAGAGDLLETVKDTISDLENQYQSWIVFEDEPVEVPPVEIPEYQEIELALDGIGADVGKMSDMTKDEIKYLKEISGRKAINRYTTAEVRVEQTNNNNVGSNMDIDGIISRLNKGLEESIAIASSGDHF